MDRYTKLGRRAFIAGAGGAVLSLPLLQHVSGGTAIADARFPKRLLVFVRGQGTILDAMATPGSSETDWELGEILAPLAAHKEQLSVITGVDDLSCLVDDYNAHLRNALHALTAERIEWNVGAGGRRSPRSAGGPSVDQVVASKPGWGDVTAHRSLSARIGGNYTYTWAGVDQPIGGEERPSDLFDRVFAEMAAADPNEAARLRRHRRSVLDAVGQSFDRVLRQRVATEDRLKIERHLEAVRELERSFGEGSGSAACAVPDGSFDETDHTRSRAHIDLLVMALACDLTRVATISYGDFDFAWRGLRFPSGWHDAVHAGTSDPGNRAALVDSYRFFAEELAYLLDGLAAVPEGDGTMLDNTLVLYANNFACGCDHSFRNKTFCLAGGGNLGHRGGRLIDAAGATANDFFITVLQLLGFDDDTFGMPDFVNGPIAGLA